MTEGELAELERFCAANEGDDRGRRYFAEEVVPALIAEVRRLREALAVYRHTCSDCDSVELCLPSGYDWNWTCADYAACEARFEAKYPLAYAP